MVHREAEIATARAAGAAGTAFALATATSYPLEDVASVACGPRWFQLYVPPTRAEAEALVSRAAAADYSALVVTVDTSMHGLRERDIRNRLIVPLRPLRLRPGLITAGIVRPRWSLDFLRGGVGHGIGPMRRLPLSIKDAGRAIARPGYVLTLDEMRWIRDLWPGKLVVKGVLRGEDCPTLLDLGVDGIIVSNHGGRQLDTTPASVEALPEIVEAVDGRAEVMVDGGIRRGTDVVKALALGARAVLIGRPYLYGLARRRAGRHGTRWRSSGTRSMSRWG